MSLWTRTVSRAHAASAAHDVNLAAQAAYRRGRRDERADRVHHPYGMTALVVLAIVGAGLLALAVMNGSFSAGGAVADQQVTNATPAVQNAVANAGQAAQNAGDSLVQKGKALTIKNKG